MQGILIIPIVLSFLICVFAIPIWIGKAKKIGLIWEDMNKYGFPKNVAGSGGLPVIFAAIIGILVYIAIKTFYFNSSDNLIEIFAAITSLLILAQIGIVDDLLGWRQGGLSKKIRVVLCFFAAIPLMVINANNGMLNIPFVDINIGIIYPLILIPIAIIGTATTFNFLAGFNGLEASQGILILGALSLAAYFSGSSWLALIGLIVIASLIAFWIFNKYPAKTFPGDVLTYPIGGMIGIMAILGGLEKFALFLFIPYILEVILKLRGELKMQSFGKPNKSNDLDLAYEKIYGLEHLSIWILNKFGRANEKKVVYLINSLQILIIILGFIIFRNFIFK